MKKILRNNMACKGCKKKPLTDLLKETPKGSRKEKLTLIALVIFSTLAVYGAVRLIIDIKNILGELWQIS